MEIHKRNNEYHIIEGGRIIDRFEDQPTLDNIREMERKNGEPFERLDILRARLSCISCGKTITERFTCGTSGNLLCWKCAMEGQDSTDSTDTAKVVLGESGLYHKSLCDYVINVATGCTHGCKFCYVPSTPNITARQEMLKDQAGVDNTQQEWGSYLLYRDDLPERLSRKLERKQKWRQTERGRGVVMLSSGTDCYQDRRTAQITRGCVAELVKHHIPVRILTRSPAVVRDIDLYKEASRRSKNEEGHLVRIGSSIPCLDDEQTKAIEPGAPVPSARLNALQQLSDEGVPVYVSMSPTYPTQNRDDFENLLRKFAELNPEVVFHEPINPRGGNFDMTVQAAREAGQDELATELEKLKDRDSWVEYSLKQMKWVEELGEELEVNVHVWPDKKVIKYASSKKAEELQDQRKAVSPENIAEVPLPS